jgi:2-desacetyl-2-hydroxyethyl bacteriochlorophyllide A dehydrogenase
MSHGALSSPRRSQGQIVVARALWYVKPGRCELRTERLAAPRPGEARVATHYSAISRGTERLVIAGKVPESEWQRMRAPLQTGEFPFPVKYGYSAAGVVTAGSDDVIGRRVFCLHPHQDEFQVAEDKLVLVGDDVPLKRATLAANMETALNAHWDAGTAPGDSVAVIGAGIVGLLTAHLAQRIAGTRVTIADVDPARAEIADALGLTFVRPDAVKAEHRIVFHTSATAAGLDRALSAARFEGRVIEMSWYGATPVTVDLGSAFHAQRLSLISSQVGHVAPKQRQSVSHKQRLTLALQMLNDPRLDVLVRSETPFETLPDTLPPLLTATTSALAPVIRYPAA